MAAPAHLASYTGPMLVRDTANQVRLKCLIAPLNVLLCQSGPVSALFQRNPLSQEVSSSCDLVTLQVPEARGDRTPCRRALAQPALYRAAGQSDSACLQ